MKNAHLTSHIQSIDNLPNTLEMKEAIACYDWSKTSVGVLEQWPVSLKSIVNMLLSTRHPMLLWWGNDLVQFYNDAYRSILGVNGKHPSALGQKGIDCWPELWEVINPLIQQVLSGGSTWSEDRLIPIYRNGHVEDVYWTFGYSSVCDDAGSINGILVICTETTQKVLSEQHISRQISNLFIQAPVAICILRGKDYVIEMINNLMVEMWDRKKEAVINKPAFEVLSELMNQGFKELLDRVYETGERFVAQELPISLMRNGKLENAFVKFVYEPLREEDGSISGVMALAHEVTDLVVARKKIEEAEQKARIAIESAELGIYELNLLTRELTADERFFQVFNLSDTATWDEVISSLHPEDLPARKKAHELIILTGALHYEARVIFKDNSLHWIKVNGKLFRNSLNEGVKVLGVVEDITQQKLLERQKDDFFSLASHELKTPVTTIKGYFQLAEIMLEDKGELQILNILRKMGGQVNKLTLLVDNLLFKSRIQEGNLVFTETVFNFDQFVSEKVAEMQIINPSHIIKTNLQSNKNIFSDHNKLGQVLTNLISNSIKYSSGVATIVIQTTVQGYGILLSVQDNGIGIAAENLTKVFDQFYRSEDKFGYAGMGIGLYISAEIITRQNGKIWVESLPDQGATFKIWLPFSHRSITPPDNNLK